MLLVKRDYLTLISSILILVAVRAPLEYWLFAIFVPFFANVFFAFLGTVINTVFPRFDYQNEAQIIKQSLSVFIVMMVQLLVSVLLFSVTVILLFVISPLAVSALMLLLFAVLAIIFYVILTKSSTMRYEKLDA